MKEIIIKDMVHAIDLTIERHQAVLDGRYSGFSSAKLEMKATNWNHACPLCEFAVMEKNGYCYGCPWYLFNNRICNSTEYENDKRSITRLKKWRKKAIKLQEKKNETK